MSNKKRYGLNFDFIILRVKNIEKMKDFYVNKCVSYCIFIT